MRDISYQIKTTQPSKIRHYEYACIGSDSCLKQKNIEKLFVKVLKYQKDLMEQEKAGKNIILNEKN